MRPVDIVKSKDHTDLAWMLRDMLGKAYGKHPSPAWAEIAIEINSKQKGSNIHRMDKADLAFMIVSLLKMDRALVDNTNPKDLPTLMNHEWLHESTKKYYMDKITQTEAV